MNKTGMDFITEVTVSMYLADKSKYVDDFKIMLPYDIDIEYRSWGIKGIHPSLPVEFTINYFERDFNDDNVEIEKEIKIALNDLKREFVQSVDGFGMPDTIELWIKEDGSVDYEMSSITFWMAES